MSVSVPRMHRKKNYSEYHCHNNEYWLPSRPSKKCLVHQVWTICVETAAYFHKISSIGSSWIGRFRPYVQDNFFDVSTRSTAAMFYKAIISQCCGTTWCRFFIEYNAHLQAMFSWRNAPQRTHCSSWKISIAMQLCFCKTMLQRISAENCSENISLNLLLEVPCISTNRYMLSSNYVFDINSDCSVLFMFKHVLKYTCWLLQNHVCERQTWMTRKKVKLRVENCEMWLNLNFRLVSHFFLIHLPFISPPQYAVGCVQCARYNLCIRLSWIRAIS